MDSAAVFTSTFDCALTLCAEAQQFLAENTASLARIRPRGADRAALARKRQIAREAESHLTALNFLFESLRMEVESATDILRAGGEEEQLVVRVVSARVRLTLYERAFGTHETEPIVQHVEEWTRRRYRAA